MSDPSATPDARFAAIVEKLLSLPGVTYGSEGEQRFGANALKVNGSIFAMLTRDQLVVKLPRQRVDALVAAGVGQRYDPRHDGRLMKEWLTIAPTADADWLTLAYEAFAFVGASR